MTKSVEDISKEESRVNELKEVEEACKPIGRQNVVSRKVKEICKSALKCSRNVAENFREKLYGKEYCLNERKYIEERRKCTRLFEGCTDRKTKFFEIVNNRDSFRSMGEEEYDLFKQTMPYIVEVYEEELAKAGKKLNYIELLTKLKLVKIVTIEDTNTMDSGNNLDLRGTTLINYICRHSNNKQILNLNEFKMQANFTNLKKSDKYYTFLREMGHIFDTPIRNKGFKRGLSYCENGKSKFDFFNQCNNGRRTRLAMNKMSRDGFGVKDSYLNTLDRFAEKRLKNIFTKCRIGYEAIYGNINDLKYF